jgi:hypothetical protein
LAKTVAAMPDSDLTHRGVRREAAEALALALKAEPTLRQA